MAGSKIAELNTADITTYLSRMREIGEDIASISNHVQMVNHIYSKLNKLMDAACLAVSYYDEAREKLIVPCTIERGEQIGEAELSLTDTDKMAVKCFNGNLEVIINSEEDLPKYGLKEYSTYAGEPSKSIIYIPLSIKGKPIGTITVQSFERHAYSESHVELLRILAIYTSISIQNTRTLVSVEQLVEDRTAELETMNERASALNRIGYSLSSLRDVEAINAQVYKDLSTLMKLDGFGIGLVNEVTGCLEFNGYIEAGETLKGIAYGIDEDRLCTNCYNTRETIHISRAEEINQHLNHEQEVKYGAACESIIYTPLIVQDECIGVLTVQSFQKRAYSWTDVALVESLSAFVASALENTRMFEHLRLISAIGKEVSSTLDVVEIADKLYEGLSKLVDTTMFILSSYNPSSGDVQYLRFYEKGERLGDGKGHNIQETESFAGWCIRNKESILINRTADFKKYLKKPLTGIGEVPQSLICLPLIYEDECLGVLTVQSFKESAYTEAQEEMLKTIGTSLAVAMNNAREYNTRQDVTILGTTITGMTSLREITQLLYGHLKKVMPATGFGIGSYDALLNGLVFSDYIENESFLETHTDPIDSGRLSTICYSRQETIHTGSLEDFAEFMPDSYEVEYGDDTLSIIYVPLMHAQKCLGVITVQSADENQFTRNHVQLIESLAPYTAVALDNISSFQNLSLLANISQQITSTLSIDKIAEDLYHTLSDLLDAFTFALGTYSDSKGILEFVRAYENKKRIAEGMSYNIHEKESLATYAILHKEVIHISQSDEKKKYISHNRTLEGQSHESIIYMPIVFEDEVLGVFTVQSLKQNAYSKHHVEVMKTIASSLAVAFNNSRSHEHLKVINELGQEITAQTDPIDVLKVAYERLSRILRIDGFGIGVYNPVSRTIDFPGFIEAGTVLPAGSHSVKKNLPSTHCFRTQKTLHLNKLDELTPYLENKQIKAVDGEVCRSIVYVPVSLGDEKLGVATIQAFEENAFTAKHVKLFTNLCSYIAVAIDNARSYNTINTVAAFGQDITSKLDLELVFDTVYQSLRSLMFVEFLVIAEYDSEKEVIRNRYRIENGEPASLGGEVSVHNDNHPGAWCLRNRELIHVNDLPNQYHKYSKDLNPDGDMPMSVIYKPLLSGNDIVGLVSIQSYEKFAYNNYHLQILELITPYITSALQNGITYEKLELANEQLEKLSIVASETDNAITIARPDGTYEWVNEACCDLLGKTFEEIVFGEKNSILKASSYDEIETVLNTVINEKKSVNYESLLEGSDNVWVQTTLTPILNDDGELSKLVAIDSDITQMKKAQEALKRSEEDYKRLFDKITDAILITDKATGKFIDCNDTALDRYGYSKEEIRSMSSADLHPKNEVKQNSEGTEVIDMNSDQFHHVKKNGERIVVEVSSVDIFYKGYNATLNIVRDVTEVRKFQEKILEQNAELEKLSIVASSTDNVVIICAPNGDLLWANESYKRVFGKTIEERARETGGNLLRGSGNKKIKDIVEECIKTRKGVSYESKHVRANGDEVWLQSTLTPVITPEGELKNLVIIDSDITQQKLNEFLVIEKNKDITDSINYASRLQKAILPDQSEFNKVVDGAFVLFEPRDIVSGDFYWMTRTDNNEIIVAAIDCTGHGVPGAFLTITGNDLLNQIVVGRKISDPASILNAMNKGLLRRLHTHVNEEIKDGMDIAVCRITTEADGEFTVDFAGAYNPLYYVVNRELKELKGNRFAIGTRLENGEKFEGDTIRLPKNAMLYLFSDGYHDQLGGKKGKKFMKSRFRDLLVEISDLEVDKQHDKLKSKFDEWCGEMSQVDDVLVMGIRL